MSDSNPLPPVGKRSRVVWTTRLGVILAVTGSAVGLGNFLRFPGVAVANGGGAFMIPYVIAFVVVGLPIAWIEWSMGRYAGRRGFNSAAGVYRSMMGGKTWASYLGVLALIIPVIIYMYYLSVEAWCLGYAWYYWSGGMSETIAAAQEATAKNMGIDLSEMSPEDMKETAVSTKQLPTQFLGHQRKLLTCEQLLEYGCALRAGVLCHQLRSYLARAEQGNRVVLPMGNACLGDLRGGDFGAGLDPGSLKEL